MYRAKSDTPIILHYMRGEVDSDRVAVLITKIALLSGQSFKEVYMQLAVDVKTYFDVKTAEAVERIESEEVA